ncbi:MAG: archease [Candidatus Helarchaeota archaeon]
MAKFRYLEHISDVYIEATGNSIEEAFIQGACAIFEVMTDFKTIEPIKKQNVHISAEDLDALLFEWINYFLYLFDVDGLIFSKFEIQIHQLESGFELVGECWGEEFDRKKHPSRTEIKAATYSLMEIIREPSSVTIRFVVDI